MVCVIRKKRLWVCLCFCTLLLSNAWVKPFHSSKYLLEALFPMWSVLYPRQAGNWFFPEFLRKVCLNLLNSIWHCLMNWNKTESHRWHSEWNKGMKIWSTGGQNPWNILESYLCNALHLSSLPSFNAFTFYTFLFSLAGRNFILPLFLECFLQLQFITMQTIQHSQNREMVDRF